MGTGPLRARSGARERVALALVAGLACAAIVAPLAATGGGTGSRPADARAMLERCDGLGRREGIIRCQAHALRPLFARRGPGAALRTVERLARDPRLPRFAAHCHRTLHEVAARYARERGLTIAGLAGALQPTYGPGCTSGFDHGLIIETGARLGAGDLAASGGDACRAVRGRFARQACVHGLGHAFLAVGGGTLPRALRLCRRLGPVAAPDCADAAFHGTALGPVGEPPRPPGRLCGGRRGVFGEVCWRRAWTAVLEHEVGPRERWSAERWLARCRREPAASRAGCVTTLARHLPSPPRADLSLCRALDRADRLPCVKGIRVSDLRPADLAAQLELLAGCSGFGGTSARWCREVLGRNLDVLTDGRFARNGCRRLAAAAHRRACLRGAARSDGPLVTYG